MMLTSFLSYTLGVVFYIIDYNEFKEIIVTILANIIWKRVLQASVHAKQALII